MGIFSRFKNIKYKKSFFKGISLFDEGNYDDAKDIFSNLLDNGYEVINCNNILFEINFNNGDLNKALFYLNNSLELCPENNDALINKGLILYELGQYDDSLDCYNKSLMVDKNNDYARTGKLYVLIALKRFSEAKKYYKSFEVNTRDDNALNNYASILISLNYFDDALKYLNKAIELNSNDFKY